MKTIFLLVLLTLMLSACKKKTAEAEGSQTPSALENRQAKLSFHRIENACVVLFADYGYSGFALTSVPCP